MMNARWAHESLLAEQQALRRLTHHGVRGVPRIAIDVEDGQSVLVTFPVGTPLVASSDSVHEALGTWRDTKLCGDAPLLCAGLLRGVLDAMKQCHAAGVIHGDPRLSNIVVVKSLAQAPSAVLIDFGSAILAPHLLMVPPGRLLFCRAARTCGYRCRTPLQCSWRPFRARHATPQNRGMTCLCWLLRYTASLFLGPPLLMTLGLPLRWPCTGKC